MKKIISLSIVIVIVVIILVTTLIISLGANDVKTSDLTESESGKITETKNVRPDIPGSSHFDYYFCQDAQELTEKSSNVITGKITGVSFYSADIMTQKPPTEKTEINNIFLYAVYDIEVFTSYKGKASGKIQITTSCGPEYMYKEDQVEKLGNQAERNPDIKCDFIVTHLDIDKTYLFTLRKKTDLLCLTSAAQSAYDLENPYMKYQNDITAKDVISCFGADKWDSFWTQWQKDNPGRAKLLNKNEIAEGLYKSIG